MGRLIISRLDQIATNVVAGFVLLALVAAAILSWGILASLSGPTILVFLVVGMSAAIWGLIGLKRLFPMLLAPLPFATKDELAGPFIQNRIVRLHDMIREELMIRRRTFQDCDIY